MAAPAPKSGILFLPRRARGERPDRSNVCVSGYDRAKPNFALSNFEENEGKGYQFYDPDKGLVHFPTSEHYLQFQKLNPRAKDLYYERWQRMRAPDVLKDSRALPPEHSRYMATGKFDNAAWDARKVGVQMQINAAKYEQSLAFKACIQKSIVYGDSLGDGGGPIAIIEDTSTAVVPEKIWGTGPLGDGTNILGNSQTAFAKMVADKSTAWQDPPQEGDFFARGFLVPKVQTAYATAQAQFTSGVQKALIFVRRGAGNRDTSDIAGIVNLPSVPSPEPSSPPKAAARREISFSSGTSHANKAGKVDTYYQVVNPPLVKVTAVGVSTPTDAERFCFVVRPDGGSHISVLFRGETCWRNLIGPPEVMGPIVEAARGCSGDLVSLPLRVSGGGGGAWAGPAAPSLPSTRAPASRAVRPPPPTAQPVSFEPKYGEECVAPDGAITFKYQVKNLPGFEKETVYLYAPNEYELPFLIKMVVEGQEEIITDKALFGFAVEAFDKFEEDKAADRRGFVPK